MTDATRQAFLAARSVAWHMMGQGLLMGIILGLIAALTQDTAEDMAQVVLDTIMRLTIFIPVGMVTSLSMRSQQAQIVDVMRDLRTGLIMMGVGSVLGTVLLLVAFFVSLTLVCVVFGGVAVDAVVTPLWNVLGWQYALATVALTGVVGVAYAFWRWFRLKREGETAQEAY